MAGRLGKKEAHWLTVQVNQSLEHKMQSRIRAEEKLKK